jgi:uncharacterized protein (TIGR00369 family)
MGGGQLKAMDSESKTKKGAIPEELIRQVVETSGFANHLGMKLDSVGNGRASISLDIKPIHANTQGIVHGGVICSLADQVGPIAMASILEENQRPRSVQLDVHYLSPAKGGRLTARAVIVKPGRSVSFCDIEISDDTGRLVAAGRMTLAVVTLD